MKVDKEEMAVGVDKDGSALIALLGKFSLQLHIETHFC
jgi:hypothetical protein